MDDLANPLPLRHGHGIPAIDVSANAAFGATLIGAGTIGLILYLRGDGWRA